METEARVAGCPHSVTLSPCCVSAFICEPVISWAKTQSFCERFQALWFRSSDRITARSRSSA